MCIDAMNSVLEMILIVVVDGTVREWLGFKRPEAEGAGRAFST